MNITIDKEQEKLQIIQKPINHLHKTFTKHYPDRFPAYTTAESTCESSGVSMNCSEEFISEPIDNSEDFPSRDMTTTTTGPQSGLSDDTCPDEQDDFIVEDEAIYYFGYGPNVNPIVRARRGCTIPPYNIKSAILYDHRLKFVAGGTANVVPSRGWDVKGVLLRFKNAQEWEAFRQYDANYDVREVSVSVIDKTNIDPKNKNTHTAPFEIENDCDLDVSERSTQMSKQRMHKSCIMGGTGSSSLMDLGDDSPSEEDDYSCPFSFEPKSKKKDPNAVKCRTFMITQTAGGPRKQEWNNGTVEKNGGESVIGRPQERYLKLVTDGLRAHEIDEAYIRDEILAVNYIPNERDKVVDQNYRTFPSVKPLHKLPKISQKKYETKLCNKAKDPTATLFVIGTKIMKVEDPIDVLNPCVRWLAVQAHGKGDITLLVHQTFVDKDCLHIPLVSNPEDLTEQHEKWAEHVIFLYLERGGLTATVIGELTAARDLYSKANKIMGVSMPSLTRFKLKVTKETDRRQSLDDDSVVEESERWKKLTPGTKAEKGKSSKGSKRSFGGALGRFNKSAKPK